MRRLTISRRPSDRPRQFENETTYTGDPTIMSHQSTREWIHSLSAVLGGLIDAGLAITMFREHEGLALAGSGQPGACVGKDVAAAGWNAAHSLVVFGKGKKGS
jgi:hypothetical protein